MESTAQKTSKKHVCIGSCSDGLIYATIETEKIDGKIRLSIHGVIGPKPNGNANGHCGQINKTIRGYIDTDKIALDTAWTSAMVDEFLTIWDTWHLNDMKAGTLEQTSAVKEYTKKNRYNYDNVCEYLRSIYLYEVADPQDESKTYKYGHGCFIEIPENILQWLNQLPSNNSLPIIWQ